VGKVSSSASAPCLLQQHSAAILTPEPLIDGLLEKAPGGFNTATWNPPLGGLTLNYLFGKPQIACNFFQGQDWGQFRRLAHDFSFKRTLR